MGLGRPGEPLPHNRLVLSSRPQIKLTTVQEGGLQPAKLYSGTGSVVTFLGFRGTLWFAY